MSNEIKDNEDIHSKVEINEIIEPTIANDKQDTESIPLSDANDEQEQPSAVEVEVPNGESISLSETNNEQEESSAVVEISNEESQKEESQKEELISDDNPVIMSAPSEQINEIQENSIVVEVESTHVDTDRSEQTPQLLQTIANQSNKEASSTILNTLVEGDFDLDKNYIIQKPVNLTELFTIFNQMSSSLQAEILSVLIGIMRKSERNLLASNDAQIYDKVLILLNEIDDDVVADLLVDILTVLTTLTINVNQLKLLLQYLKTEDRIWKKHAVKLLQIFKTLPYRYGPDDFFNFSGRNNSGIILPPIKTWPYQNGFTISTWFRIDPVANGVIEKEKPYLYSFCTSKGHGYTAHFVGHCLVITYSKLKEKTFQHCIQYEFKAREWYMITFAHQYQRWSKSSIHCYINGQSVSTTNFPWSIESGDVFDKCYIGCTHDRNDLTSFSGQLSTFYLFSFYLEPLIVQGLYRLGPAYKNQFKFENESAHVLSEAQRKAMYDGKLMNSIVFNYNPIACEGQLVLQAAPKTNVSHFVHTAHAQMLPNVRSVLTHSIYSTLHSVGGIQVFYPLFGQLDHQQTDQSINYNVCSILLTTLCDLIERSYTIQHQMLNSKGFLAIGYHLEKVNKSSSNSKKLIFLLLFNSRHQNNILIWMF